jgi:hypothetical protein
MSRERQSERPSTPPAEAAPVLPPVEPNPADVELTKPLSGAPGFDLDIAEPELPRPELPVVSAPETMDHLEEEIRKAQLAVDRDKRLLVTMEGDEQKLRDLIARRDALKAAQEVPVTSSSEPTPESISGPSPTPEPEPAGEAKIRPEPAPQAPTSPEGKTWSFKEVLTLQESAFSARRDMIRFRHGKKVAELTLEDQEEYKRLRSVSQEKRKAWLARMDDIPEVFQQDLKSLTTLKEVQEQLASMTPRDTSEGDSEEFSNSPENLEALTPEQILTESLLRELEEKRKQLKIVNLQFGGENSMAQRNEVALKELRARRRALLAQIAEIEEKLTGEGVVAPEPEPEPEIPREENESEEVNEPSRWERAWAESKGRVRRMLRSSRNELTRRISAIRDRINNLKPWDAWNRLQATREADQLAAQRQQIEDESRRDKVGFGTKFKEKVKSVYRSIRNRLRRGETTSEEDVPVSVPEPEQAPVAPSTPEESAPRPEKGKSWNGWLKERTKGLFTFGIWEQVQARRFAKGTKTTAKDLENFASQIQKEQNLSLEDAMTEAQEIQAAVQTREGEGTTGVNTREIERVSREVTARKVGENNEKINEVILTTIASLEDRLKKYKGVSGQDVLTEDAKNKIATEIQRRLNELRGAYIQEDAKELTGMLRERLEPDWWKRVAYGGLETALWMVGGYVGYGMLAAGKETVGLQTTIWAIAKQQCIEHGISNPSNAEIMKVAIQLCKDSGVKVVTKAGEILWSETASGVVSDTSLAKGFPVVISGAAKVIASF